MVLRQLEVLSLQLLQLRALCFQGPLQLGNPPIIHFALLLQGTNLLLFREEFFPDLLDGQVGLHLLQLQVFDALILLGKLPSVDFLLLLPAQFSLLLHLLPPELKCLDLLRQCGLSGRQLLLLIGDKIGRAHV